MLSVFLWFQELKGRTTDAQQIRWHSPPINEHIGVRACRKYLNRCAMPEYSLKAFPDVPKRLREFIIITFAAEKSMVEPVLCSFPSISNFTYQCNCLPTSRGLYRPQTTNKVPIRIDNIPNFQLRRLNWPPLHLHQSASLATSKITAY